MPGVQQMSRDHACGDQAQQRLRTEWVRVRVEVRVRDGDGQEAAIQIRIMSRARPEMQLNRAVSCPQSRARNSLLLGGW